MGARGRPPHGQAPQPNQLWRWSPGGGGGGGGGGAQAGAAPGVNAGTAAGLAVALLVGLANIAFAVFQARTAAAGSAYAPAASMGAVFEASL